MSGIQRFWVTRIGRNSRLILISSLCAFVLSLAAYEQIGLSQSSGGGTGGGPTLPPGSPPATPPPAVTPATPAQQTPKGGPPCSISGTASVTLPIASNSAGKISFCGSCNFGGDSNKGIGVTGGQVGISIDSDHPIKCIGKALKSIGGWITGN